MFLAIDLGSSQIRVAVGRAVGAPLAVASWPVTPTRPELAPHTGAELDLDAVWRGLMLAAREAIRLSGVRPSQVTAIGVTSQRLGLVLLDADGHTLYAGPNTDARAVFEGAEIDATHGDVIWSATGHGPAMLLAWAKLLWFKNNAPAVYARVRTALGLADWLAYRLTGVLTLEPAAGVDAGMAMVATGFPASALGPLIGVDEVELPVSCTAGMVAGTLKSGPARDLGLSPGIPVIPAGPDTQAGLAGMGMAAPGSVGIVAGWSAAVQLVTAGPLYDGTRSMWTGRHVVPGRWVLEGNAGQMGGAYSWLAGLLCGEGSGTRFQKLDRLAAAAPLGARGASAFLGPSFVNMVTVGLRTGGVLFPVPLAFEPPDRGSLARAVLENFGFALRYNLDRLALTGGEISDTAVGGGMARVGTFRDIVTACAGRPVMFNNSGDATLRGTLSMAGAGSGDGPDLDQALAARRKELKPGETSLAATAEYEDLYHAWRARERRLSEIEL